MSDTFIVTGAAGFIGSHLTRSLIAAGHRVIGIDNFDPFYPAALKRMNVATLPTDRFDLVTADVRHDRLEDMLGLRPPRAVFHLAGLAGVRSSVEAPQRYADVNVGGLCRVLAATAAAGCRRVVFASSSSVYGDSLRLPFAEADPLGATRSPYAATKRDGELICHAYCHRLDLRIAMTRLFTVYGPSQRPDLAIARFMHLISAGEPVPTFGDGSTRRDYTFVDDIVAGLLAAERWTATQIEPVSEPFNLGSGRPVSLDEMIERVSRVVGRSARRERLPVPATDLTCTWADLSRSRHVLDHEPRVDFDDGLREQWNVLMKRAA